MQWIYVSSAKDIGKKKALMLSDQAQIAAMDPMTIAKLQDHKEMAIGMKVMKPMLPMVPKASSKIDPRGLQPVPDKFGQVYLKYPPALVVLHPDNTSITDQFRDKHSDAALLKPGQLPIMPMEMDFLIWNGDEMTAVTHRQFSLTASYPYTHEKSQGQTLDTVLVDLAAHPGGELMPFDIYGILSMSKGQAPQQATLEGGYQAGSVHTGDKTKYAAGEFD
ncbi:hypothetical protein C8J56DRAFT_890814 [Mycena floridula]|nr:hypothetical protein C8J56DRAFT_890814 [Mycena floridula]